MLPTARAHLWSAPYNTLSEGPPFLPRVTENSSHLVMTSPRVSTLSYTLSTPLSLMCVFSVSLPTSPPPPSAPEEKKNSAAPPPARSPCARNSRLPVRGPPPPPPSPPPPPPPPPSAPPSPPPPPPPPPLPCHPPPPPCSLPATPPLSRRTWAHPAGASGAVSYRR